MRTIPKEVPLARYVCRSLCASLGLFGCLMLAAAGTTQAGRYENGKKDSPGKRMPVGAYLCGMGSYKPRPCTVELREGRYYLTVPAGGRFPFELELMSTDEADLLIGQGRLSDAKELCPTCADDKLGTECAGDVAAKRACAEQTLSIALRRGKDGSWSGELVHYLVRGVDGQAQKGWYRLGLVEELRVRPQK